jgi:hypothetical protein
MDILSRTYKIPRLLGSLRIENWYANIFSLAHCTNFLCPGTLACVHFPHHCPCPHPDVEDKFELGDGGMVCVSKGGQKGTALEMA